MWGLVSIVLFSSSVLRGIKKILHLSLHGLALTNLLRPLVHP